MEHSVKATVRSVHVEVFLLEWDRRPTDNRVGAGPVVCTRKANDSAARICTKQCTAPTSVCEGAREQEKVRSSRAGGWHGPPHGRVIPVRRDAQPLTLSLGQLGSFGPVQLALKLLTETPSFWHCDQLPPPPRKKTSVVPFSRISAVGFPPT